MVYTEKSFEPIESLELKLKHGKYYLRDQPVADCGLGIRLERSIATHGDAEEEERYLVLIVAYGRHYLRHYTRHQIIKQKFLQEFGIEIQEEKEFYEQIRKTILRMEFPNEYISYETSRNGLQKVNGDWVFVYGNVSIGAGGYRSDIRSSMGGTYFPEDIVFEKQQCKKNIVELFRIYRANPSVFYIPFFLNIMGITNAFFREIGEDNFMRLSLWLDGASGSGKTEIAKAGAYAFGDKELERKVLVSVTGKTNDVLTMLIQCSGGVGIVDDVKEENVRERRNSVRNNIDDCIRSVYQSHLTRSVSRYSGSNKIDCCVIITGEYLETSESQNARIIYMNVDGFLKNAENAKALRYLQEHPKLLSSVCGGYIQFLLKKMQESSFKELVKLKLKEVRDRKKIYKGISNSERLNQNRYMLEMAAWMAESYFRDIGMQDDFINDFCLNAGNSIEEVMDATFYLLGGGQMVFLKAMERVLLKAHVRKACYSEKRFRCQGALMYDQKSFWIDEKDDFLWIEDYKESMLRNNQKDHWDNDEKPVLLIRKERLDELYRKEIYNLLEDRAEITSKSAEKALNQFGTLLRKMQVIFQIPRSDSELGRDATEYPVFTLHDYQNEYDEDEEMTEYRVTFEKVVQINTGHQCVEKLLERMKEPDLQGESKYKGPCRVHDEQGDWISEEEIYDKRRKFITNKKLYKK